MSRARLLWLTRIVLVLVGLAGGGVGAWLRMGRQAPAWKRYQALAGQAVPSLIERRLTALGRIDRCETCHLATLREGFEQATPPLLASHPHRRTLLAIHPPERFGCTSCHNGAGSETTTAGAHARSLLRGPLVETSCLQCHPDEVSLRAQLACARDAECPPGLRCAWPTAWTPGTGLPAFSLFANQPAEPHRQRQCTQPDGRAPFVELAPRLTRGLRILEEAGCAGCHRRELGRGQTASPTGPDLHHVRDKIRPDWLASWLRSPQSLRPHTRMPSFPTLSEPTDEQAVAIATFLLARSTPWTHKIEALPVQRSAARGRALVSALGCLGCHRIAGFRNVEPRNRAAALDAAPDLSDIGAKTDERWLYSWLKDPKSYDEATRMPSLRLTDSEAADIATFLATLQGSGDGAGVMPTRPRASFAATPQATLAGQRLVAQYGCHGCHSIPGFEASAANEPDLPAEPGAWPTHVAERVAGASTAPRFTLDSSEIEAVGIALAALRAHDDHPAPARMAHALSHLERAREQGRRLVRRSGCTACHSMDGAIGDIRQLYPPFQPSFAPPDISGEGLKVQPEWLRGFLQDVVKLRIWLEVRMPTFSFSDREVDALVAMFASIDGASWPYRPVAQALEPARRALGARLFLAFRCRNCHLVGPERVKPEELATKAANLLLAKHRLRGDWILRWLEDPDRLMPGTRMPAFFVGGASPLDTLLASPEGRRLFTGVPGVEALRRGGARSQIELLRDFILGFDAADLRGHL